ncbi:MAG: glycosyltransferase family 2 protein [Bacilli bacterium]|nr:glycosyltransferase family 2 protein [Bacilli bacterium]
MVSIIVPCFNSEKYIKRCLDSIKKQNYNDIEVIIINDGSTDNTSSIVKKYLDDQRFKLIETPNNGIGKTRNFGIKKANGEYIMFLDSDDYLTDNCIEEIIKTAKETNADIVVGDYYVLKEEKTLIKIKDFGITSVTENPEVLLDINFAPWAKLYKKEVINNITFEESLKYEDAPFTVKSLLKANKISKINYPIVYYIINKNSETTTRDEKVFDILKIIDIIRNTLEEKNISDISKKIIVRTLTNYTIQQRYNKDYKVGSRFIDEAFAYMEKYVPDYKNNKYYENRGFLKRSIEKSKMLTKIYCRLYLLVKQHYCKK